jgi:hypothetical protein
MELLHTNERMVVLCGSLSKGQRPNLEVYQTTPTRIDRSTSMDPLDMVEKPWKTACRTDCSSLQVDQGEHPNHTLRLVSQKLETAA